MTCESSVLLRCFTIENEYFADISEKANRLEAFRTSLGGLRSRPGRALRQPSWPRS
jgi:hypothetical protein